MKNIKWLLIVLAAACLTTACGGSSDDPGQPGNGSGSVVGQWHMLSWSSAPAAADIYLSFDDAGAFDLYQRLEKPTYEHFSGMTLQVYQMNYQFLSGTPEKVVPAGGMTVDEEGWVVPDYPDSRFLIFRQEGQFMDIAGSGILT